MSANDDDQVGQLTYSVDDDRFKVVRKGGQEEGIWIVIAKPLDYDNTPNNQYEFKVRSSSLNH